MLITINTYNDYLTEKKAGMYSKLNEGTELNISWGPLVKLIMLDLFVLYDSNGLRPYVLFANNDYLVISFTEET